MGENSGWSWTTVGLQTFIETLTEVPCQMNHPCILPECQSSDLPTQQRARILVVDDDLGQTEVLAYRLKSQGYQPITRNSGTSGLQSAVSDPPNLVILDINMPDMNGLDICAKLNDDLKTANIPVIILSGSDGDDVVKESRMSGGRFFIRKPYDPNALLALIETALAETTHW